MWTCIHKQHLDRYLNHYPELYQFKENIILHETDTLYILPRLFYNNKPSPLLIKFEPKNWKYDNLDPSISFNATLKPSQQDIVNKLQTIYNNLNYINGIIQARPGTGKTVIAIYLSILFNLKPLFIVDNNKLLTQWTDEILKFTNLSPDQIGIIKGNKLEINDSKHMCIAMVQTLVSKSKRNLREYYDKFKEGKFGIVFYDECHKTTAGEKYAKGSLFLNTQNIIGLSATPFVSDEHEILLHNTIGEILVKSRDYDIIPKILFVKYNSHLHKILSEKQVNSINYLLMKDRILGNSKYNSVIYKSPVYLELIRKLIIRLKESNHKVIIIAFTKKQVETISESLTKHGIKNIMFYSKQQKVKKGIDNVLIATYQFASHGFDYKELSSIILACPLAGKKSLIQCIGRVLRSCEGKTESLVLDLIDTSLGKHFINSIKHKKGILSNEFQNCKFEEVNLSGYTY